MMLKFYRKHIKLFIWLIVLSFAAWGAGTLTISKESSSPYAGSVEGEKISFKEFLTTLRFYELLTRAQTESDQENQEKTEEANEEKKENQEQSEPQKNELISFEQLQGLTWQAIILSRQAHQEGVAVSDQEVRDEIEKLFSTDGIFNQEFYQSWIRDNFRGPARDFEEATRKYVATRKIREKVLEGVPEENRQGRWMGWLISAISRAKFEDYTKREETPEPPKPESPELIQESQPQSQEASTHQADATSSAGSGP